MGLEDKISSHLGRICDIGKDVTIFFGVLGILGCAGLAAYAGANVNRENIRRTISIEGSGQKIEYIARTPRDGLARLVPWNDSNGHAIINYGSAMAIDEDYNGSLADGSDVIAIRVGGKTARCFLDKAINADGNDILFVGSPDPIVDAMIVGAKDFCNRQRASANAVYQQVISQLSP